MLLSRPNRKNPAITDATYMELIENTDRSQDECDYLNQMVADRFVMLISTVEIVVHASESAGLDAYELFFPVPVDPLSKRHEDLDTIAKFVDRWSDIPFHYLDYAWDRALRRGLREKLAEQFETFHPRAFEEVTVVGNKVTEAVVELLGKYQRLPKSKPNLKPKRAQDAGEYNFFGLIAIGAMAIAVAGMNLFKAKS